MTKFKKTVITLLFLLLSFSNAKAANASTVLLSQDAYQVCTRANMNWVNFCNGLIQGYADYASLSGRACIPSGVTRTQLVTLFTSNLMKSTKAYQNNQAALLAGVEVFELAYPCKSS
jgi:hypothetical protein